MDDIASHLGKPLGFTCQTWLATEIAKRYFGRKYRVWFATSLNPPRNGSSSNPMIIFEELERIIDTNDHSHGRIEQIRLRLSSWVVASSLASPTIAALIDEIRIAPVRAFRPAIWRIDLARISIHRLVNLGQFPDEYQIRNLRHREFEVVTQ